jgi:ABC-type transport system involved in multi-copper enzyme maturation permease subunit
MLKIYLLSWLSFKEGIKDRVLYGIVLFFLLTALAGFIFIEFFSIDVVKAGIDFTLSAVSLVGLLILFFLFMPMLNKDLDKKTIYFSLSSPISRSQFILGKFFGFFLILLSAFFILSICSSLLIKIFMLIYPQYSPPKFSFVKLSLAIFFNLFSLLVLLSVIFFFWTISSKGFIVAMLSLFTYIIGESIAVVKELVATMEGLTKTTINVATWIFPNLCFFDLKNVAAHGLNVSLSYLLKVSGYGLFYIMIILTLTILIFKKRDLT